MVYGAFHKETKLLCSYAWLKDCDTYMDFCVLKSIPEYERLGVNAAVVSKVLEDINHCVGENYFICDGARNILHETAFQEYLEKNWI